MISLITDDMPPYSAPDYQREKSVAMEYARNESVVGESLHRDVQGRE
jgi:hypothetical protein